MTAKSTEHGQLHRRADTPRARYELLHRTLRERICLLAYPPGKTLSESELATEFHVSRTPVRRVLQALENEGLVETKQSVGTIVTSVDLKSLRDVYAIRMILAEALGRLSHAGRARDSLPAFHALNARSEALLQSWNFEEFVRINNELQHRLGLMTGNEAYERITAQLYYQTVRAYFQIIRDLDRAQEVLWLHEEIAEMIRAIEANDAQAVGFVRRNHISMNLVRITNYVLGHAAESYPSLSQTSARAASVDATSAAAASDGERFPSAGTVARRRGERGVP